MDPGKIIQIITNSTLLASRLLSGAGGPLQFSEPRYCLVLAEDAPPGLRVTHVSAAHKDGVAVRYSITGGNRDGLFTIDQRSGLITLAAPLDYELQPKHELVVAAEAAGRTVHSIVQVTVADVNDNPPHFLESDIQVTVVEEDDRHLPATIIKVEAADPDRVDSAGLVYSVGGDGVDGLSPSHAYFTINPHTGHLLQLKALDRDPPLGRETWKVKVQVRDGQRVSPSLVAASRASRRPRLTNPQHLPLHHSVQGPSYGSQDPSHSSQRTGHVPQRSSQGLQEPPAGSPASRRLWITHPPQLSPNISHESPHVNSVTAHKQKAPPEDQFIMPHNPEKPPKQQSVTSLDPQMSEENQYVYSRDPSGLVQADHVMSQKPEAEEGDYFLYQDLTGPIDPYFLTRDPMGSDDAVLVKNKEGEKKDEWLGEDVEESSERAGKGVEENVRRLGVNVPQNVRNKAEPEAKGKKIYQIDEINGKNSKKEGENRATTKHQRKRGKFIQKRRRAGERKRKLRDKNTQTTKEILNDRKRKTGGSRQSIGAGGRRWKLSPGPGHGSQARGRKVSQQLPGSWWGGSEDISALTSGCGNLHPGAISTTNTSTGSKPLRIKYFTQRKYEQNAVKCRRLSARGTSKLTSPYNARGKLNAERNRQLNFYRGVIYRSDNNFNQTFAYKLKLHVKGKGDHASKLRTAPRSRHNRSSVGREIGGEGVSEGPSEDHRLFAPSLASTTSFRSEGDLPSDPHSVGPEGKRADMQPTVTPINKRDISRRPLNQLQDERLYVKRFGADGGGCDDYSIFSMSSEEPPYLREMRREQVHVAETVVTVVVKDINDNAPVFPNATIYGEVQENGPIDLSVGVVWAWDADDEKEGTNAHLTYTIEKNVMDERSGQAIFTINPETGLVRTAICCLDRESTPEYFIQVVAVDGGGLKGTGTVVVRLADVNDNSPRLTRDLWQVEVDETWGDGPPTNHTLLEVSTADHDTSNYFFYRVVESSGWGWQHFGMRTEGVMGHLFANKTLDYEDAAQRRGFRFMVQVTDRGRGGWSDARHTDTAWVEVSLRDVNDNPPQFSRPHAHVTVREDTAPGTLLASLPATDPDMMEQQGVDYRVVGGWGAVTVDADGGVRLWRALDREAPGGEVGVARVVAVDEGRPSLSSTATLTITLTDVNDCPPRLLPPTVLHVREGAPASLLGILTATDDDVWALGHGPPFTFTLAPSNPAHVFNIISINYQAEIDSGRGGAEVWTRAPLDREEHRQLVTEVVVTDAGGLAATHPVTIIIDDINDNPMKPAAKTVYLCKTQGGGADAALGRVYVEDPDDWDLQDKTFEWAGPPHPLFTLQPNTGDIFASMQLREGRYELQFVVSDRVWAQRNVEANVSVVVRHLTPEALAHAVPVTLMPTTPATLTAGWTPMHGGGGLGTLSEIVMQVVGKAAKTVEIVSVYGGPARDASAISPTFPKAASHASNVVQSSQTVTPFACVWVSVRQMGGSFIDPVKLHGLLALHLQHLEKVMNLKVALEDTHTLEENSGMTSPASFGFSPSDVSSPHNPSSVASLASVVLPLQVVDTNLTSLVTPRLTRAHDCHTHTRYEDETCTLTSCLNGGRCVSTHQGSRCVCPGESWGSRCKILARTFSRSGWAWVRPLPPCLPTTLSLRLLTHVPDALILYSGPLSPASAHPHYPPTPMVALQLVGGHPQVLLEGARGPAKLQVNTTLKPGTWHTLHLHLNTQGVMLMVDHCGHGWRVNKTDDSHCIARIPWANSRVTESWSSSVPLQLGGLAHPYPQAADFGWSAALVYQPLDGCISHLTVNGQLVDLGEPSYSAASMKGCRPQEAACGDGPVTCGLRGQCVGGLESPKCDCQPGWMGPACATPTVPVALGQASFAKVALSFIPDPYDMTLQLRMRTRGLPNGLLMQLSTSKQSHALKLHVRSGVMCSTMSCTEWGVQEVCLEGIPLGDGSWHTIRVGRHGHNLIISVDDGDGWRKNETLASFFTTTSLGDIQALVALPPLPITVDKQDGLVMGGIPEFESLSLVTVHDDLQNSCIDDVRVSGHPIPLPPSVNGTNWGQVTTLRNLKQGCSSRDSCSNTTCLPPLSCHDIWRQATCSCEPGRQLVGHSCQDVDECVFQPCLHGGTCYNLTPGYHCLCGPAHTGDNCEWTKLPAHTNPLTAPMAIAAVTLSVIIVVVLGVLLTIRLHRYRTARGEEGVTDVLGTPMVVQAVSGNPQSKAVKEENILLGSLKIKRSGKITLSLEGPDHIITPLRLPTIGVEAIGIKEANIIGSTLKHSGSENKIKGKSSPQRCSIAAINTVEDVVLESRASFSPTECPTTCISVVCPTSACPTTSGAQVITDAIENSAPPLLAQDDLRAYAYEGDGSPSGSLTSTVLGLRTDSLEGDSLRPLIPEYGEVFDLLKNLPDAVNSLKPSQDTSGNCTDVEKLVAISSNPKLIQNAVNIT